MHFQVVLADYLATVASGLRLGLGLSFGTQASFTKLQSQIRDLQTGMVRHLLFRGRRPFLRSVYARART